jgi:hypothetical protein
MSCWLVQKMSYMRMRFLLAWLVSAAVHTVFVIEDRISTMCVAWLGIAASTSMIMLCINQVI